MESSALKNITTLLVIATAAFLGYYLFVQKDQTDLALQGGDTTAELFTQVQKYIERNQQLDRIKLNTDLLADERFQSLTGFPTEVSEQSVGRDNPFDRASASSF